MDRFLKVEGDFANLMILAAALVSAPLYVFFAWLSDRVGRKPVMLAGMTLGLVTLYPGFVLLSSAANPALVHAGRTTPVVVVADPADCGLQFDVTGRSRPVTSCDIAKAALANAGVGYRNASAPSGKTAEVRIGELVVPSVDGRGLSPAALKAATDQDR